MFKLFFEFRIVIILLISIGAALGYFLRIPILIILSIFAMLSIIFLFFKTIDRAAVAEESLVQGMVFLMLVSAILITNVSMWITVLLKSILG